MSDLVISDTFAIPEGELVESFARSGGPGGQHVNKTETKVELRWSVSGSQVLTDADRAWLLACLAGRDEFIVVVGDERSQARNRAEARRRLAAVVREALQRPTPRKATRPTRASSERRLTEKRRRGERKATRGPVYED